MQEIHAQALLRLLAQHLQAVVVDVRLGRARLS